MKRAELAPCGVVKAVSAAALAGRRKRFSRA